MILGITARSNLRDWLKVSRAVADEEPKTEMIVMEQRRLCLRNYQATDDVKRSRWIWGITLAVPAMIAILGLVMVFCFNMLQSP